MTMNGVIAVISRCFTEFGRFGANHITAAEVIPIFPNLVFGNKHV